LSQREVKPLPPLKRRWAGRDGQRLAREVVLCLLTGTKLDGLGLGQHGGRTDLRGLWLASARGLPGPRLAGGLEGVPAAAGVTWSGLDLSGATFRLDLEAAVVVNSLFDRVGWQGWRVSRSALQDCSFAGADLRDASFDHGNTGLPGDAAAQEPTSYLRCSFARTRTGPYASWGQAHFNNCEFDSTKFTSPHWFRGAELTDCTFRGQFRDVIFGLPNPGDQQAPRISGVDVRDATFEDLTLMIHRGTGLIRAGNGNP